MGEMFDPHLRARRPIFQTIILWDVFKKLYGSKTPPAFSTFFTNHIAGVMHRYWKHVFPEDFHGRYDREPTIHLRTMDFAMKILDEILLETQKFAENNPSLVFAFATSMGQGPIEYDSHQGFEASIANPSALLRALGVSSEQFSPLLAMAPQAAVRIPDPAERYALRVALESARTASGKKLFVVLEIGESLSITILTPHRNDIESGGFQLTTADSSFISWVDAGVAMNRVDPGTAYHIPEGILAVVGEGIAAQDSREPIPTDKVKAKLMSYAEI
jgi:hypothetical protein